MAAGVGLRGLTSGTINLTGVPAGSQVTHAFLIWGYTNNTGDDPAQRALTFAGAPVTGSTIGTGPGTCWATATTYAYWADVTSLVSGNGAYGLSDVTGNANSLAEGASLVAVYANPAMDWHTIVISTGDDVITGWNTQMDNTFIFDAASGADARTTFVVGDGQTYGEDGLVSGTAGAGDISFSFQGSDGDYWDTDTYDVTSLVGVGSSSLYARIGNPATYGDCLMWAGQVTSVATTGYPKIPLGQTLGGPCNCTGTPTGYQHLTPLPVNTATGALTEQVSDAAEPAPGEPFQFTRSYTSLDTTTGPMGPGWTFGYNASLTVNPATGNITVRTDTGSQVSYTPAGAGSYAPPPGARSKLVSTANGYRLTEPNRTTMDFDAAGRLTNMADRTSRGLSLAYTGSQLTSITDAANRVSTLSYTNGLLTKVTLADGRHVDYGYTGGYLTSVTDLRGKTTVYDYDAGNRLKSALDPKGHYLFRNTYNPATGRVTAQLDARGDETTFAWNPVTEIATTTDPRGGKWLDYYADNLLLARADPLGHTTSYGYDQRLNKTTVTDARGNTTTKTYNTDGKLLTRTAPAPLSYLESWTYNGAGDVLTHTDRRGKTTTNTYNAQGLLQSVTDPLNHTTSYTYNNLGLVETVTDPRTKVTAYGYDAGGNPTSITTPLGAKTTMTYDASGHRKTVVDPRGNVAGADPTKYTTAYTYDDADHIKTLTDPRGGVTSNTYDDAGLLWQHTNAATKTTTYLYDAANNLHTVTDPRGNITTYEYDPDRRLTDVTTPEGAHTVYKYDLAGHLYQRVDPRAEDPGATPSDYTWTYTPDENGNQVATSHPNPAGGPPITTSTIYDVLNRPTDVTDGLGHTTHTDYDGNNNTTKVTDPLGHASLYDYYDDNRLHIITDARGKTTSYNYDYDGNRTKATSPLGEITTYGYDDDGQLTSMVDPRGNLPGAVAADYTWTYGYDKAGNPTTTTNPHTQTISTLEWDPTNNRSQVTDGTNDVTKWTYDAMNRVDSVTGPDQAKTSYTYDNNGNLATRTDANTNVTSFGYDKDNHLTTISGPLSRVWTNRYNLDGQLSKTITPVGAATPSDPNDGLVAHDYDSLGRLTQTRVSGQANTDYSYDPASRPATMTDEAGTETYGYDNANRLTSVTRTGTGPGASPATYGYGYTNANQLNHRDLPDGLTIDLTYDDDGRPATLTRTPVANLAAVVTLSYGYDEADNQTALRFPNGDTETRTYDRASRLTKIRTTNGPNNATTGAGVTLIAQHEQALNADGQPTSLTTTQGTAAPVTTSYGYTANRLAHYTTPDGWTTDLSYDGVGNRKTETRSGNLLNLQLPVVIINGFDAADQQTSGYNLNGLAYDNNGNQTNDGAGNTYTYDAAGHVRTRTNSGTTTTYGYAGDGRRLTATTAGKTTRYAWDINNPLPMLTSQVRPTTGTSTDTWDYLTTADGRTLGTDTTPTTGTASTSWLHTDPIGSITETTTPSGALAHTYTYDPYGKPLTDTTLTTGHDSPLRYTGEYLDPDGTYNLRARHYQPTQGRFTQIDPLPSAINDPYVAAYVYVNDLPTKFTDPSGMCKGPDWMCDAADAVAGAAGDGMQWVDHNADALLGMAQGGAKVILGGVGAAGSYFVAGGCGLEAIATSPTGVLALPGIACGGAAFSLGGASVLLMQNGLQQVSDDAGCLESVPSEAAETGTDLVDVAARRVTLRQGTKDAILDAQRAPDGKLYDPNTGVEIPEGEGHFGHRPDFEWRKTQQIARDEGWTREELIEYENDPSHYQYEDPSSNMSHRYESP